MKLAENAQDKVNPDGVNLMVDFIFAILVPNPGCVEFKEIN